MAKKFYLDTSIWRDYYENRSDNFRPIGEWAFQFLQKVIKQKNVVIYSDLVLDELKNRYTDAEIQDIFEILSSVRLLEKVPISQSHISEARRMNRERHLGFGDCLHAILARNTGAMLVSRDAHFLDLADIAEVKKPEDLL